MEFKDVFKEERFENHWQYLNFQFLAEKINLNPQDKERFSLFYILSSNIELFKYADEVYSFKENQLNDFKWTENGDCYFPKLSGMCNSNKKLLNLGLQLYNSQLNKQNVIDTFCSLDEDSFNVAINAIKIRFNQR